MWYLIIPLAVLVGVIWALVVFPSFRVVAVPILIVLGMGGYFVMSEKAAREQKLFQRFKADESAQAITAKARMVSPEDNNERQAIHDHESVEVAGRAGCRKF